jgi:hypothetical protein
MAISPQLRQFKSSGVYRLEFDKSQTANINVETLRLIVGHSKKGAYNTPVLIENAEDFVNAYGNIDKGLEKKGMFFHRSAIAALSRGPILALNLNEFTDSDIANYASPSTNGSLNTATYTDKEGTAPYTDFHDIEKFMKPSDASFLAADSEGTFSDNEVISFVNLKNTPLTIITRMAKDIDGFEITAEEWYGVGNVPEYLNDKDYMSDYMIDVYVFKGKFDPTDMDTDAVFGSYFTSDGIDKDKLDSFANLRQVSLLAKYTGSLIPGFKDMEGRNVYLETAINAETRRTGLFCTIDEDRVLDSKVDLIGHATSTTQNNKILSYKSAVREANAGGNVVENSFIRNGSSFDVMFDDDSINTIIVPVKGDYLKSSTADRLAKILQVSYTVAGDIKTFTIKTDVPVDANLIDDAMTTIATTYTDATLASEWIVNTATTIEVVTPTGNAWPATGSITVGASTVSYTSYVVNGSNYDLTVSVGSDGLTHTAAAAVTAPVDTSADNPNVNIQFKYIKSFENNASIYVPHILDGATIAANTLTNCISQLSGTGLAGALADKDMIDFRYIVDTFGSYDTNGLHTKSEIATLAKNRQNASAILNAPGVAEFKKSTDPSFMSNGKFKTSFIKEGGNPDLNPTTLYALPGINEGANYAFYYGPGLLVKDGGKNIIVPPAAYVSNNFIDKYSAATPWSIVAGPRRGVVGGSGVVGVEYAFDKDDRDILEPFGINPIVFQRGVGLTILGNKTAQQSIKSALSSAHVREVLIYIQDGVAAILKDYVFEFNTVQTRLEIKTLVDSFLESVKQDGGVYDFKNVMDSSNNDSEVIDNNMGIVDTYVEPVKGLEIVVHRTTVLNTGEIATGNFS